MILRIKKINQIGRFISFNNGGSIVLGNILDNKKICAILGDNTYGKSTIADIFRSANNDDSTPIVNRKTIPPTNGMAQIVELTYQAPVSSCQESITYNARGWTNNQLKNKVLIFDQVFIHKNIFTGIDITRDNKENFTDFILGEEGARLGAEIENRKKRSQSFPNELRNTRPASVRNEPNDKKVEEFVKSIVSDRKEELEKTVNEQKKFIERLDKVSVFIGLPNVLSVTETYSSQFDKLVEMLLTIGDYSYDSVSKEVLDQIQEQLECTDGNWLDKGTKYMEGNKCPYCTQETSSVKPLIDAYKAVFDEKYDIYVDRVKTDISSTKTILNELSAATISDTLSKNTDTIKKYLPFIGELHELIDKLDTELEKLRVEETTIRAYVSKNLRSQIDAFMNEKQTNVHKKSSMIISVDDIRNIVAMSDIILDTLCGLFEECSAIITGKRTEIEKWTPDVIAAKKSMANNNITVAEWKLERLDQDLQCKAYKEKQEEHKRYKAKTLELQKQLETEQSNYLSVLFSSINSWFNRLGSSDFKLDCKQSAKGNKTVYELKVSFCNTQINNDNLSKVFSDSDRRNLALAIYFARAEQMDKANTILLLDDPVVSFDDNRITMTCNEMKRISSDFEQIIILTHYKTLIQQLLKCKADAVYVKLKRVGDGINLASFNAIVDFQLSDHEQAYLKLTSFANGGSSEESIVLQLRPFMERHIDLLFQPDLIELGLVSASLNEKITGLKDANKIADTVADKLHIYRETLNPDHHRDSGDMTIENNRAIVKSVLEDLYNL